MADAQAAPASPTDVDAQPNWLMGILGAAGLALAAGIIYAVVAILIDREFVYLALLAGLAAGFGIVKWGGVANAVTGAIAAVLGVASWILGVYLAYSAALTDLTGWSFGESFGELAGDPSFLPDYFSSDFWGYIMLVVTAGAGFYLGSGLRDRSSN